MQRGRRNWLSGAGCCGLPDFSTTVTCLKFMKCSSRLVRPCTSSSVGPLGSPQQFTGKSPQGALAAWGKGRDRGEVDPTQLGGFNLFLTAAGGASSRLVPKRHLITLPRAQVIYIRLPTTAAAPRCRVGRGFLPPAVRDATTASTGPRRRGRGGLACSHPRGPWLEVPLCLECFTRNIVCVCVPVCPSVCPHSCCAPCRSAANPQDPPSCCNHAKMAEWPVLTREASFCFMRHSVKP